MPANSKVVDKNHHDLQFNFSWHTPYRPHCWCCYVADQFIQTTPNWRVFGLISERPFGIYRTPSF